MKVTVVGSGVIGLTCGVKLSEAGFDVKIVARERPPNTTSNKAAAIWYPYEAEPLSKVKRWAGESYRGYESLLGVPQSGVSMVEFIAVFKHSEQDPFWLEPHYRFRRLPPTELPPDYKDGYAVTVPFVHSGVFLRYLVETFEAGGRTIETRELESLAELRSDGGVVVNCSGLGSRRLADDRSVYPIRAQILKVRPSAPIRYIADENPGGDPIYVLPRGEECILGGTAEKDDDRETVDPATTTRILKRCRELEPRLRDCTIVTPDVGLRPGRPEIRLESCTDEEGRMTVHNYGHGGSGFTVAWGCATEVVGILQKAREARIDSGA